MSGAKSLKVVNQFKGPRFTEKSVAVCSCWAHLVAIGAILKETYGDKNEFIDFLCFLQSFAYTYYHVVT